MLCKINACNEACQSHTCCQCGNGNYHSDRGKSLYFSIFYIYKSLRTYCSPADQAAVYCSVLDFIPCCSLTERTDFQSSSYWSSSTCGSKYAVSSHSRDILQQLCLFCSLHSGLYQCWTFQSPNQRIGIPVGFIASSYLWNQLKNVRVYLVKVSSVREW